MLTRPVVVGAAPTLPSASQVGLPPASTACCDRPQTESFHLRPDTWNLVAHHRLPVVAGGLHHDQRHPSSVQPGGQVQQRPGGPSVLPDFLAAVSRLVVVRHSDTHRQAALPMSRAQTRSTRSTASSVSSMSITSTSSCSQAERFPGEPTGRNAGGLACSKQQCRALERLPPSDCYPGSTGTKHRRRRRATSPIFTPARGVPPGHRRLLCAVNLSGGLGRRVGRSVPAAGTAGGR